MKKGTKKPTLSKSVLREYAAFVTAHAGKRRKAHGLQFNAVDFAMGAACLYFFFHEQHQLPASWILGPLGGNDPFTCEAFPRPEQ